MRHGIGWSLVIVAPALLALVTAVGTAAPAWQPADQPDLQTQLTNAPALEIEQLGAPPGDVTPYGTTCVLNPDGKTWDILQWYYKDYMGPTWLYAIDLGSGEIKKQRWPDRRQLHLAGQDLGPDGKYYMVTSLEAHSAKQLGLTDYGMELFVYDPATNTLEQRGVIVPKLGGERRPFMLGPDGRFYGSGNYYDPNKAGAYIYDPKTGKVTDFGPIGPDHAPNGAYGYSAGVDDEYFYVASGKIPWYLLAVNIKTGEVKTITEAPNGDYPQRMRIWQMNGGARAWVYDKGGDGYNDPYEGGTWYWLYHGQKIPMGDDVTQNSAATMTPPWKPTASPWDKLPPEPQVHRGQLDPNADGNAYLWYRLAEDQKKGDVQPGEDPREKGWRRIHLQGVETYPLSILRLVTLHDGRLFGTAPGYLGRFLFDPKEDKIIPLGRGGASPYAFVVYGDKLYWSGYSPAPIYVFDPARPWTADKSTAPGEAQLAENDPRSNHRLLGDFFKDTRVKKMFTGAVGADGLIYFGGEGQRDYTGGGLGWINPKTNEKGGLWRPFSPYRIFWLTPALDGAVLVAGTKCAEDELNNNLNPDQAAIIVFDVAKKEVVRKIEPVLRADKMGPMFEVKPGVVLGTTQDPEVQGGGLLYAVDIRSGETLFLKKLPWSPDFPWMQGTDQWDYVMGPDRKIYTWLRNVLVRINPEDVRVEVIGTAPHSAQMTFVGNDLYLAGGMEVRRIRNVTEK